MIIPLVSEYSGSTPDEFSASRLMIAPASLVEDGKITLPS